MLPQGNQAQNVQPIAAGTTNDPARVAQSLRLTPWGRSSNLLDTNRDQKIEATELRQAVQTGVHDAVPAGRHQSGRAVKPIRAERGCR